MVPSQWEMNNIIFWDWEKKFNEDEPTWYGGGTLPNEVEIGLKNPRNICVANREKGSMIQKWKFTRRAIEERVAAPNAFKDSFSIIYILQNNVNKKFLIALHKRSVQKLIESRIIRKSIFWIVGPFSRIALHMQYLSSIKRWRVFAFLQKINIKRGNYL